MPSSTTEAAAVLGPDGLVYVVGGKGSEGAQSTIQAYNPATNTWARATSLPSAVSDEAVVVDVLDRIEVIGGNSGGGRALTTVNETQSLANVAPLFTGTSLPAATAGAAYTATVPAIGAPAPTFSLVSGPAGLTVSSTGVISWAPTTAQLGTQAVTVQATNAAGSATQTISIAVNPDTTPPTVPVLSVGTITSTSAIPLNWTASTDNVGVAGYRLYWWTPAVYRGHSGRGGGITLVSPAKYTLLADNLSSTSYTVTGLSPNSTYHFAVAAFDAAGNQSAYSNIVSGTTLLTPTIYYSTDGVHVDPPVSVVANHQLSLLLWDSGNPTPTLSLVSAPAGVVFSPSITWTPTADEVGVNDIVVQATNSVGTFTLDIPVTVTPDVPVPSLSVNGGITYTLGNMTAVAGTPNDYTLALNPAFNNTGTSPQYALSGTPFAFLLTGTSNTNPTTYALVSGPATMTIDPNTGAGTWAPTASDAGAATNVTVSATNSAGTSLLTFAFPTYFTTAPTNVAVGFYTSTPGTTSAPVVWTPVVTWSAPANAAGVADYKVSVTSASTGVTTVYETQSTATSYTLPTGIAGQNWVNVTAYDANGEPSQTSTDNAPLYLIALPNLGWSFSTSTVVAGQPLSVQFNASGVTYGIVSGPAGVTIDPSTGLLSWAPGLGDVGNATIVVSAATNGWGTMYATLSFPVYFTDAPTGLSLTSGTDPNSGLPTWTASWSASTQNTSSIVGYQITVTYTNGSSPTVLTVPATSLSAALPDLTGLHGAIQVAAYDANGNLGAPSLRLTF
jgi:hypothetical protein